MRFSREVDRFTAGRITALRVTPDDPQGLIVWYHGWSSAAAGQLTRARIWADAGWEVIIPSVPYHDDRGTIDYEASSSYPLFWETVLRQVTEARIWTEYAAQRGYDGFVTAGHSLGGCTALGVAAHTDAVRAVIAINGSGHWPLTHLFMQARFGVRYELAPDLAQRLETLSPHTAAKRLAGLPVRLVHGVHDTTVDARADRTFADLVREAGGKVIWQDVPEAGHAVTTSMMDDAVTTLSAVRYSKRRS